MNKATMTGATDKIEVIKSRFRQLDLTGMPAWLANVRTRALAALTEQGLPARHWESWRYTPVQLWLEEMLSLPLPQRQPAAPATTAAQQQLPGVHVHCVDGRQAYAERLPEGVSLQPLTEFSGSDKHPCTLWLQAQQRRIDPLANLATTFCPAPVLLHIHTEQRETIHIWHRAERDRLTLPVLLIWLEAGASATVIEHFGAEPAGSPRPTADYMRVNRSDIVLNRNARLNYYRLNNDSDSGKHIGYLGIEQHTDSQCEVQVLTTGGNGVRNTLLVEQVGTSVSTHIKGNAWVTGRRHCDYHLTTRHLSDYGQSDARLHSVAADRGTMVVNGLIHIAKNTRDNSAQFQSRNLLLSEQAEINTKPELEIYADQVQCSHGASIGRLDDQALFYLRSRGIGEQEARSLLLSSFLQGGWRESGDAAFDTYCLQLLATGLQTLQQNSFGQTSEVQRPTSDQMPTHSLSPSSARGEEEH